MTEQETFDQWCVLELMGHRRLAGRVTEAALAGGAFLRIDVYGEDEEAPAIATQFYSPSSVYAITPASEAVCRRYTEARGAAEPVSHYDLALPAPVTPPSAEPETPLPASFGPRSAAGRQSAWDDEDERPF